MSGAAPRLYGAQASGCAPIVHLVERGGEHVAPVVPETIARSIAIGNPADGRFAAERHPRHRRLGHRRIRAALVDGIKLLAETTGVFTETAGGVTVAAALALAQDGKLRPRGRGRPLHHRQRTQDRRGAARRAARRSDHRAAHPRTGGSVWP